MVPYMVPSLLLASHNTMVSANKKRKLLHKAFEAPNSLRFSELCRLAEYHGWIFERQKGTSHRLYLNPRLKGSPGEMMNFQNRKGQAKYSQVKQPLAAIEDLAAHLGE